VSHDNSLQTTKITRKNNDVPAGWLARQIMARSGRRKLAIREATIESHCHSNPTEKV